MFKKIKNDGSFEDFRLRCLKMSKGETCAYKEYRVKRIDFGVYEFSYKEQSIAMVCSVLELLNGIILHEKMEKVNVEN